MAPRHQAFRLSPPLDLLLLLLTIWAGLFGIAALPAGALFERIAKDPRHHRMLVLSRKSVPAAAFGDWSMGFVEGSQRGLAAVVGFNDFFRKGFDLAQISASPGRAKELALAFREGRFRQFVDV